jgi:3-methyladenine DNA glycosylase AlkD
MHEEYFKKCLTEVESKVGITPKNAPAQRKLPKQKYSFSELSSSEQLIIWDYIWNNSSDFWTSMQSFLYCESQIKDKEFLFDSWEIIKHWQKQVNNWGYCDALSKIYTKILELNPYKVLEQLKQWNKSTNLWDRRQSIVSLLYFSRTKKVILPYNTIIQFINRLIDDKEYYVQKAIGWALKELYNVYSRETLRYLEDNIKRVSSIAFTAATEKLKKEDKERLKKIRKLSRQHQIQVSLG